MLQKFLYFILLPFRLAIALVLLPIIIVKALVKGLNEPAVSEVTVNDSECLILHIKNAKRPSGVYTLEEVSIAEIEEAIVKKLPKNAELDGHGFDGEVLDIFLYGESANRLLEVSFSALEQFELGRVEVEMRHKNGSETKKSANTSSQGKA